MCSREGVFEVLNWGGWVCLSFVRVFRPVYAQIRFWGVAFFFCLVNFWTGLFLLSIPRWGSYVDFDPWFPPTMLELSLRKLRPKLSIEWSDTHVKLRDLIIRMLKSRFFKVFFTSYYKSPSTIVSSVKQTEAIEGRNRQRWKKSFHSLVSICCFW